MSYTEFLVKWRQECQRTPALRRGQALMNLLFVVRPDLYDSINMTAIDPFYTDASIPTVLTLLNEQWDAPVSMYGK